MSITKLLAKESLVRSLNSEVLGDDNRAEQQDITIVSGLQLE
jgi:hypothetical protein